MIDANSQFFAILTNVGMAKQANADALGIPWLITQMGVGDANPNGLADPPNPVPSASQAKLLNEWRRKPLNQLKIDPVNPAVIIAEQIIPADEGGKWIREIGLYDADGDLVAVANCAPSFKPLLSQGSGRTQIVRMNFIVTSTGNIQLKIDPAIVLASRAYVDAAILEVLPKNKAAGQYTRVKVNDRGVFVSGDNPETLAGMGIKDTYTKTEIEAMIAQASALPVGATVAFPLNKVAPGFLELDGSVKSAAVYPDLAAFLGTAFNKGDEGAGNFRLPESRGEFLRGWDHGRGIDAGRLVGSYQDQAVIDHFHTVLTADAGPLPNPVAGNLVGSANANLAPISRPAGAGVLGATLTSNVFGPAAAKGGMETRPRNLAVVWCIKAWNAPINQGNIDIAALAALVESCSDNGPVVGSMRGDRMQVTAASSVATFKVDEVIVGNANGKTRTVRNLSQVIDLASATKGLGAMDVGAPPANGYVALYAFFNADSNAMGVMAFNCTSVVAPVVYGGAAPPAGYSFSALVGVWPTNASGQFQVGLWEDQTFYLVNKQVLSTSGGRADFTPFTAAAAVPMNAKKCQGHVVLQNNLTNANTYAALGGVGGVGAQFFASNPAAAANGGYQSAFPFIPLTTPQTLYHILSASIGVATFLVNITAYKI